MIILTWAEHDERNIIRNLGHSEYSYYFVQKAFNRVLAQLVTVVTLDRSPKNSDFSGNEFVEFSPTEQADAIHRICQCEDEPCVLLSFTPPHRVLETRFCPTVPVFAWEFHDIPNEAWDGVARNNWVEALAGYKLALTHSKFAVQTTRKALGEAYPIESIPAPIWSQYGAVRDARGLLPPAGELRLRFRGTVFDSRNDETNIDDGGAFRSQAQSDIDLDDFSDAADRAEPCPVQVALGGVLYTAVLNPADGRKNWQDMLRGFCVALRECEDATLVIKTTHATWEESQTRVLKLLQQLQPMRCRVVILDGFLEDDEYAKLAGHTHFAVNTSVGEGQCLPLMEYLSCGVPAIAPFHTAMSDYLDHDNAFEIESSVEPASWPHDSRKRYTTLRHRLNVESLMNAFEESYRVSRDPVRYAQMSAAAVQSSRRHNSDEAVLKTLRRVLQQFEFERMES